jgi:SAM-dependent methyltransferase
MDDLDKIYRETPPGLIPWNITEPPELLASLVNGDVIAPCRAADLGCGLGNYTIWMAIQGFTMTGIDLSPTAVEKATQMSHDKGVDIEFLAADLTKPFSHPKTFLFAYDWDVLHHIYPEHREQYAVNVSRLLAPGGKYLSVCFSEKDSFCGPGKYRTTPIGTHLYFSSEEEIRDLFGKYFRIIELDTRLIPGKTGDHLCAVGWMEKDAG